MSETPAVLITGGAKRIGAVIAAHLGRKGAPVAVHYHSSEDEAAEVVAGIEAAGGRAAALQADLRDRDALDSLMGRAAEALGPVTCLINNASLFEDDGVEDLEYDTWLAHMEVHAYAPMRLARHMAERIPAGEEGNIINMIDERVWRLTPKFMTYTVSKSALWTLTRTLAQALAPDIRVNAIGPGPVLPSPRQDEAAFRRQVEALPLRRNTTPEEIARAVDFILDMPAMTGQMIALDGGQHLAWQTPDVDGIKE